MLTNFCQANFVLDSGIEVLPKDQRYSNLVVGFTLYIV